MARVKAPPKEIFPAADKDAALNAERTRLGIARGVIGQRPDLVSLLTPKLTKYIPHRPHAKQAAFLLTTCKDALYGGAAGGGKSDALLMAALQYVDIPGYAALLLRRTYADLSLPEALMDRAHTWLDGQDSKWNEQKKTWYFPSGATLTFGYLEKANDHLRYQGAAFTFIGFDEVTQFLEKQYKYLFSRLRKASAGPVSKVPLRMRCAGNPGGVGHEWVKRRFLVEGPGKGRVFVPAWLRDNPSLDREGYESSLSELDSVQRAQLLEGSWTVKAAGAMFRRERFNVVDMRPLNANWVRYWDLAGTKVHTKNKDPDWTVGALVGEYRGRYLVGHVVRVRGRPGEVQQTVIQTALVDGRHVPVYIQQDPGQAGAYQVENYIKALASLGFVCEGDRVTGEKSLRWTPLATQAEAGNVDLVNGPWISEFLDECEAAPYGAHDDQLDAVAGGLSRVTMDAVWSGDW